MNQYRQQVSAAIAAVTFHSPTAYSWFGKPSLRLPPKVKRALPTEAARGYLLFNLQCQLYGDFYCTGFALPARRQPSRRGPAGLTFIKQLSEANCGSGYWQDGWEVHTLDTDRVLVRWRDLELSAHLEDCLIPQGVPLAPGVRIKLRFPKAFANFSPGFYTAVADHDLQEDEPTSLVRVYWNLSPEGALRLMRVATSMLNRAGVPFKLKVLDDPNRYDRCDAGVLYAHKRDRATLNEILAGVYREVASSLKQRTPALTKELAAGVGLAEDPGRGESFGLHRCQLLAEGILCAHEQGKTKLAERLDAVEEYLAHHEIDLNRPFLNPGSADVYALLSRPRRGRTPDARNAVGRASSQAEAFRQVAVQIGERLSREAVWDGSRCNWMGIAADQSAAMSDSHGMKYGALGPDIYSGTSGIALFLAQLHHVTGDVSARDTALGAIRQALSRAPVALPGNRPGLYTGWVGVAFAAARVGMLVGAEELFQGAAQLAGHFAEDEDKPEFDLLSGTAGALVGLLVLSDVLGDASFLDAAVRFGDQLLRAAQKSDAGYSWKSNWFASRRHLTGFSHGTAGIAYALLELFDATGKPQYREAAEQGFRYERHWFAAEEGNWPDFREESPHTRGTARAPHFATTWCHGAPGIALSRLRAYEILEHETYKEEALVGLRTTDKMIQSWLHSGTGNYSLCHGLTGNAESLLYGRQLLGSELETSVACEVANVGLEMYARRGQAWPCGADCETPDLMLGLAGIGYFYLRMHNPAVPSIVILRREDYLN